MKETEDIIRSFKKSQQQNLKAALATVVHVQGSSYRRPGARMLVTEDGRLTGAISGGCLEGDALRKALLAINQQENKLVAYDSTDEDDNKLGIQLGCNGIVYILFEPISVEKENHPIALLEKSQQQKLNSVLTTFFCLDNLSGFQPGTCMLFAGNEKYGAIANPVLASAVEQDIQIVTSTNASVIKQYPLDNHQSISCFIELILPVVELVIVGAGNDVFPLIEIATIFGWHTTIVDGRKTHANSIRFPQAKRIIVAKPAEVTPQLDINARTPFVLMSHNYNYDLGMLRQLVKSPCFYIGLLGPKKKMEKMLAELETEGMHIFEEEKEKIYGPVGLDIGAETAEEIAVSIIAEIKAVLNNRKGHMLKEKKGFIHDHLSGTQEILQ